MKTLLKPRVPVPRRPLPKARPCSVRGERPRSVAALLRAARIGGGVDC